MAFTIVGATRIKLRYGNAADRPFLSASEFGYDQDTKALNIGDGTTTPPRILTTKSTEAFDFASAILTYGNISQPDPEALFDGIRVKQLATGKGYVTRTTSGSFAHRKFTNSDGSLEIENEDGQDGNTEVALSQELYDILFGNHGLFFVSHDGSLTGKGTVLVPLGVAPASENQLGGFRFASNVEFNAGILDNVGLTPSNFLALAAGNTLNHLKEVLGLLEEVFHDDTLSGEGTVALPLGTRSTDETLTGKYELATNAEYLAAVNNSNALTPAILAGLTAPSEMVEALLRIINGVRFVSKTPSFGGNASAARPLSVGQATPYTLSGGRLANVDSVNVAPAEITNIARTTYQTYGTHTFVVPAGVTSISVQLWGAGGGGGSTGDNNFPGGDGGAGAYGMLRIAVTPGETLHIEIGAGGAGATAGGNGGGGGGATLIRRGATVLALAGAGGGGGGMGDAPHAFVVYEPYNGGGGGHTGMDATNWGQVEGLLGDSNGGYYTVGGVSYAGPNYGVTGGAQQGGHGPVAFAASGLGGNNGSGVGTGGDGRVKNLGCGGSGGGGSGYWGGAGGSQKDVGKHPGFGGGGGSSYDATGNAIWMASENYKVIGWERPEYPATIGLGGIGAANTAALGQNGGGGAVVLSYVLPLTQKVFGNPGKFEFVVPAGVTSITGYVWGAGGGGGTHAAGGSGGFVSGTFTVTPGDILELYVGNGGYPVIANTR